MSAATLKTQQNHLCLWKTALKCQYLGPDSTSCNTYMNYRLSQHLPATLERDTLERSWARQGVASDQNQPWSSTRAARPHRQLLKFPWLGTMVWGGLAATVRAVSGVGCEGGGCRSLTRSPDGKELLVSLVAQGGGKAGSRGQGRPSLKRLAEQQGLMLATGGHCLIYLLSSKLKKIYSEGVSKERPLPPFPDPRSPEAVS